MQPQARTSPHRIAAALVASLALAPACDDELPPHRPGNAIEGRVSYLGQTAPSLERPALQVAAFGAFPPGGPPHAARVIEDPVFPDDPEDGVPYRLDGLPVYDKFFVAGQIIDLADPAYTSGPAGAYPDFCQLTESKGVVAVTDDAPTAGVDFALYDSGGAADPCVIVTDPCPEAGAASLVVKARADVDADELGDNDTAVVALFASYPGAPSTFRVLPRASLAFPLEVVLPNVAPGAYTVYVCYDVGGDNSQGLCEQGEDRFAFYVSDQTKVRFDEATIVVLGIDLDTGASDEPRVQTAEDFGCASGS
jgi:hypothetical protein